jgi:AbrB family looped-hinge helix DNA binding protein
VKKAMDVVTVKSKFQVVIPQHLRELMHIEVGDILEAGVERGKITFAPKSLIDRHLAEGLEDLKKSGTHGPYASAEGAIKGLDARAKHHTKKRRS